MARREWGTGSLREVRPGVWRIVVDGGVDPLTRRRRQITRTVRGNKRAAQDALDKLRQLAPRNAATSATVAAVLEDWRRSATLAPSTESNWRHVIDTWLIPTIGHVRVQDLTAPDVKRWHKLLADKGVTAHQVRRAHVILSTLLSHAEERGWITVNVATRVRQPKVPTVRRRSPGGDDIAKLLAAADARGDMTVSTWIRLVVVTGARRSEILALRWSDLDLTAGTVTFARSLTAVASGQTPGRRPRSKAGENRTGLVVENTTKTDRARTMPLDPNMVALMLGLLGHQEQQARAAGVRRDPNGFIFAATLDGRTPLRPERATKLHRQLCADAGVTGIRLHDLRHHAAARMLRGGVSLQATAERLGHSRVSTTADMYAGVMDDEAVHAAEVMGRVIEGR